ncbi:hypothetical protein ACFWHN_32200, partial [Streptomyces yangpuensis]
MSLPGADELFRTTGGMALQSSSPRRGAEEAPAAEHSAAPAGGTAGEGRSREAEAGTDAGGPVVGQPRRAQEGSVSPAGQTAGAAAAPAGATRRGPGPGRGAYPRPPGRERP